MRKVESKKYKLVLCDPPWSYSNKGVNGAAEKHYPTMTPTQIKTLPISQVLDDNCVLLLWSTNPMLDIAMQVIDSWGFSFVTSFPWIKFTGSDKVDKDGNFKKNLSWGTGFWVRGCSEQILIARKGNVRFPEQDFLGILSNRLKHSKKPKTLYEYAEAFPGPYLELFARSTRKGWDVWGDEVESDIDLYANVDMKKEAIEDEVVQAKVIEIREAWLAEQRARWAIGDAITELIYGGMGKTDAYRLAQSQMPDTNSYLQPRLYHKVSLCFPKQERKLGKLSWNKYREEYLKISKVMRKREKEQRIREDEIRARVDRELGLGSE